MHLLLCFQLKYPSFYCSFSSAACMVLLLPFISLRTHFHIHSGSGSGLMINWLNTDGSGAPTMGPLMMQHKKQKTHHGCLSLFNFVVTDRERKLHALSKVLTLVMGFSYCPWVLSMPDFWRTHAHLAIEAMDLMMSWLVVVNPQCA